MKNLIILIPMVFFFSSFAQSDDLRKKHFNLEETIALEGYDPVSYFSGAPVEGKSTLSVRYKGVEYHFNTTANQSAFKSNPEKYEPAYGGWCAYAMGDSGEKVKVDPETYKISNGKLYLFYNFWGNNTLKDWNENESKLKPAADKNWIKIVK